MSLGRTGVGIQNDFLAMTKNPANLGIVQRAVFSSVISYDIFNISDDGESSTQQFFNPQLLSFAFPVGKLGSIGLSVDQRSITDFKFHLERSTTVNGLPYNQELGTIRKGGTVSWQVGYGYSFKKYAQLGLSYERIYFTDRTTNLKTVSNELTSTFKDSTEVIYRGNGIRGGLFIPYKKFTGGLSGEYIFLNEATEKRTNTGDSTQKSKFDFKPAPSFSLGGSYSFSPEWLAAADIGMIFWKEFYSQQGTVRPLENALYFSAGGQYIPAPNLLAPKYYEIMQYRAGFRINQLPVSHAYEFGIDLGVGLPLQQGGSSFDINFEYGRRWDSHYKNYSEQFFSIQLGINGGRKWYQSTESSY